MVTEAPHPTPERRRVSPQKRIRFRRVAIEDRKIPDYRGAVIRYMESVESTSMQEIAEHTGVSYNTVKSTITWLARRERVQRMAHEKDQRKTRYAIVGRVEGAPVVRKPKTTLEEDRPLTWVHPIRARALGLPSAMRKVA